MEKRLKNYVVFLFIITAILAAVYYFLKDKLHYQTVSVIPVFMIITLVSHLLLMKAVSKDPKKFFMNFITAMAVKMFAFFFYLTAMYLIYGEITNSFAFVFFVVYLVYTLFEMIYIYPIAKQKNQS